MHTGRRGWLRGVVGAWLAAAACGVLAAAAEPPLRVGYPSADPPYTVRNAAGVPLMPAVAGDALAAGQVDVLLGVDAPAGGHRGWRLLGPYQRAPLAIVTAERHSVTQPQALAGLRVAVAVSSELQPALRALQPPAVVVLGGNLPQALEWLRRGQVDAVVANLHGATERLRSPSYDRLRITGTWPDAFDERHLAVLASRSALAQRLASALEVVLRDEMTGIEAHWATRRGRPGVDWEQVRVWVMLASIVAGLGLAGLLLHGRVLRREAARTLAARAQADQLRAFLAHEVRNALQSVVGAVALWRQRRAAGERWPAAQVDTLVDTLAASAEAAVGQLDGMLDQHRLRAGALGLQRRPEPVLAVVREAVQEARARARASGHDIVFDPPPSDPGWWLVDAFRLQQVLRNLVGHVLPLVAPGPVRMALAMHHSPLGADWGLLTLQVHAPGLEVDDIQRRQLFNPDQTGDAAVPDDPPPPQARRGLSLAHQLATAMGGTLVAESRPGDGLRFILHLNLQAAPAAVDAGAPLRRVLVVDDAPAYGRLLQLALQHAGIAAELVDTLERARQATAADGPAGFDLILCDNHLGDATLADLLALARERRAQGRPLPPVIGMSADFDTTDITRLSALGVMDLLTKDSDLADLVRRVQRSWAGRGVAARVA